MVIDVTQFSLRLDLFRCFPLCGVTLPLFAGCHAVNRADRLVPADYDFHLHIFAKNQ
ncbi:hypothetical protein GCK32_005517 [Trichostrongylus colubriformis]|uniref:Uncharacterized protein n=1 Tax=Trichostrongylus colubriformis TaxID=6319 RepID=A0AAN8G474_TRICO